MLQGTDRVCVTQQNKFKRSPKSCAPQDRTAVFIVIGGDKNTELIDLIRTAEKLSQVKGYSFSTNVYRHKRPKPNVNKLNWTKPLRPFWPLNCINHHPLILIMKTETQRETPKTTYSGKEIKTTNLWGETDPPTHIRQPFHKTYRWTTFKLSRERSNNTPRGAQQSVSWTKPEKTALMS